MQEELQAADLAALSLQISTLKLLTMTGVISPQTMQEIVDDAILTLETQQGLHPGMSRIYVHARSILAEGIAAILPRDGKDR